MAKNYKSCGASRQFKRLVLLFEVSQLEGTRNMAQFAYILARFEFEGQNSRVGTR